MNEIWYMILLLRHSICFILYYITHNDSISVVYFIYTTNSFVFHVTQDDPISSLMKAGYCRNM
jgi:hypothetical protein